MYLHVYPQKNVEAFLSRQSLILLWLPSQPGPKPPDRLPISLFETLASTKCHGASPCPTRAMSMKSSWKHKRVPRASGAPLGRRWQTSPKELPANPMAKRIGVAWRRLSQCGLGDPFSAPWIPFLSALALQTKICSSNTKSQTAIWVPCRCSRRATTSHHSMLHARHKCPSPSAARHGPLASMAGASAPRKADVKPCKNSCKPRSPNEESLWF